MIKRNKLNQILEKYARKLTGIGVFVSSFSHSKLTSNLIIAFVLDFSWTTKTAWLNICTISEDKAWLNIIIT